MRLAMAQMRMSESIEDNLNKTLQFMKAAKESHADLILFPEIQFSRFFPQYEARDASVYLMETEHNAICAVRNACREFGIYASPNVYLAQNGQRIDASLLIDDRGEVVGISKMVHIAQAERFYEQDYYEPADDGFHVYEAPFGRIGIVVCFDRHYPESIRTTALMDADLILIPTANTKAEPSELFEWEIRVQAFQSSVAIAMCNRTGREDAMDFSGESLLVDADGKRIVRGDDRERLICVDIDLMESRRIREARPYMSLRRPETYISAQRQTIQR